MAIAVVRPYHVIVNGNMTGTITSSAQEIIYQDDIGVQLDWTGTPTGTFDVQVSSNFVRDTNGNILNPGNWISVPYLPIITASGAGDDGVIDLKLLSAMYIRVVYNATGGSGTLNAYFTGKGL